MEQKNIFPSHGGKRAAKTDHDCRETWRQKVNERAILGKRKKGRGGDREGRKAQEAEKEEKKKGRMNKKYGNSVRDRH